ncbi:O-phosphoseryl-tRNA(Sec) selenium transferase [Chloropicon primus]|uniref:O-phosphoseryl-tRNA(Sec) selenium transferase n=2 Tax=Chloropicon primus TaxID=1764295 RepID=A0A5B8MK91_9CHLO|nr:O-phosphoseryl-tRNA(Sec) selenium transferase [Chloropicon primus]UPR00107.1 O-phosphoseryl-tRNA(Sec) selenium transferase [Chloropicon primus]|eukprot:QDZ20896.1 O-phosphoseryl-tRNA(Sec) selenium transferase [Chloropicon primus]
MVPGTYLNQGAQALASRRKLFKKLLSNRRLPDEAWDEDSVRLFLKELALMDSNNFLQNAGVGEREGRIHSRLVYDRHYGLAHGIGRSGDISAVQPKAAGSSLLCKVCNFLVKDAFEVAGLGEVGYVTTVPVATGMALSLVLQALKRHNPSGKYVLWPRIDQKTCLKCIYAANLQALVVENVLEGDQLVTDVGKLEAEVESKGGEILCVLTTTSCFAPRASDKIVDVAKLCKRQGVAHIINNAYGVQSSEICKEITSSWRKGRVDAVVQSTDKNFMVPVGGAVIVGKKGFSDVPQMVDKSYPGRASMSPLLDVTITLLSLGAKGWADLLKERESLYLYLGQRLRSFASAKGERVLETPGNPISFAMTLDGFRESACGGSDERTRFLGSMLFQRCISGARVYSPGKSQAVCGHEFVNYGAHSSAYPHSYLNAAAAIGMTERDVDHFLGKLEACWEKVRGKAEGACE